MAAFHHEGTRRDERAHLGVVEGVTQVPLEDLVFPREQVAAAPVHGRILPHPLVEVCRADAQAVAIQHRRDAHGGLAAVAQTVEADALRVHERLRAEPFQNALMLAEDDGEEMFPQRVGQPLDVPELVFAAIRIVRRKHDEAALHQGGGKALVGRPGAVGLVSGHGVDGHAFKTVLADHHGAALAGLEILGQEQDAPCEDVGPHVERHVVAGELAGVEDLAGAGIGRQRR